MCYVLKDSKHSNIEIMVNDKADKVIEEPFQSLLSRYQIGLETSMKDSEIVFVLIFYMINVIT